MDIKRRNIIAPQLQKRKQCPFVVLTSHPCFFI